jgi:hypothetical protein
MQNNENEKIIKQFIASYNEYVKSNEYKDIFKNDIESIIYDASNELGIFQFSDEKKNEAMTEVVAKYKGKTFKSEKSWQTVLKQESKIILIKNLIETSCKNKVDLENVIINKLIQNF